MSAHTALSNAIAAIVMRHMDDHVLLSRRYGIADDVLAIPEIAHGLAARTELVALRLRVQQAEAAILDIDAHATPLGSDDDGFVSTGYLISVGSLHRALGVVGRSSAKCRDLPCDRARTAETDADRLAARMRHAYGCEWYKTTYATNERKPCDCGTGELLAAHVDAVAQRGEQT